MGRVRKSWLVSLVVGKFVKESRCFYEWVSFGWRAFCWMEGVCVCVWGNRDCDIRFIFDEGFGILDVMCLKIVCLVVSEVRKERVERCVILFL